ncbi:MAG: NAD(P)/FAD-dependent oxidoreductase [Acidimicrobiia bacterium]
MPTRVVILGAGFGGLELSTRLSEQVADEVEVTLIDRHDSFVFGFSKLDVLFGKKSLGEVRHYYRDMAKPSVEFRHETVTSIDPEARRVVTDKNAYDADILVVALGAGYDPDATPGLLDGGYEFYSEEGAERAAEAVADFSSGAVVIGVLGPLFKCPPAPFETAFLLHDALVRRSVRDATSIHVVSPLPKPIPISDETSGAIVSMLTERGIETWFSSKITRLDAAGRVAHLEDGRELPYDLFLGVPVHRAPAVVVDSGLTDDGWIAVDVKTFATKFPDVYAVGDVTSAPVPRAGVIAEGEAATLADVLVARIRGGGDAPPYGGIAVCYVEMGGESVGGVNVNFLSGPRPTAVFRPPSTDITEEKQEWAESRRRRWFGR